MTRLRFITAGESHGPALMGVLEGMPAGLPIEAADIDRDLARRQLGYGRGGRMRIEKDVAEILAGVRFGLTLGSPVGLLVRNRDFASWTERMQAAPGGPDPRPVRVPRPGHADLAGGLKYGTTADLRNILERASARETTMRVALGAVARALLRDLGVQVGSYVRAIGHASAAGAEDVYAELARDDAEGLALKADEMPTRALDAAADARFTAEVDEARKRRDTVGGIVEVVATGVPVGLGSHVQWDRKLDGRLAQALMSIPAIKAVEVGDGWSGAGAFGSQVHDPIHLEHGRVTRSRNRAGGLEGGITNGEPLVIRIAMKPIATVPAALDSMDLRTLDAVPAHVERSDTCAVPAAGVIAEAMVALALADALLEALGGDTLASLRLPWARARLVGRTQPGHLFLLGPMGVGKTATGAALAQHLGRPFVDLDGRIAQQTGKSIAELFRGQGEAMFRALEAKALTEACAAPDAVVALGGGTPLTEQSWRTLRRHGVAVRLHAEPEELVRRLSHSEPVDARPLLAGGEPIERLYSLARERERWYARADVTLDTTGLSTARVAEAAAAALRSLEGPLATVARRRPAVADSSDADESE